MNDADFQIFIGAYNALLCNDQQAFPGGPIPACYSDLTQDLVVDDRDFQLFVKAYDAVLCP